MKTEHLNFFIPTFVLLVAIAVQLRGQVVTKVTMTTGLFSGGGRHVRRPGPRVRWRYGLT
jgi:hypothetical protein